MKRYSATVTIRGLRNTYYPGYTEGMMVPLMAWFKEHKAVHGWIDRRIVTVQQQGPVLLERKWA